VSGLSSARAVVWLDRDGTLVDDPGYLADPARLVLLPGAAEAIGALRRDGAAVVLVTNQSGIARGRMTREDVDSIHAELARQLVVAGAGLDGVYVCPHLPAELLPPGAPPCRCRKPGAGLVEQAQAELGLAGLPAAVVGDKESDLGLARAIGALAVLVLTGNGARIAPGLPPGPPLGPDHVALDLAAAVPWLRSRLGLAGSGAGC
jgi:histidinol-phosphate phosphatase family protein